MNLAEALAPLTLEDFVDRYYGQRALVLKRKDPRYEALLSLQQLEDRVNDGTGCRNLFSLIGRDGRKIGREKYHTRPQGAAWAPDFLNKRDVLSALTAGHSFVMHNLSQLTPELTRLTASIEATFPGSSADAHIYVSPRQGSTAYQVHRDEPQHKIYLQLFGTTTWKVFRGTYSEIALPLEEAYRKLELDFEVTLLEGSLLYLPPSIYHHVEAKDGPRVSISIPFYAAENSTPVDRTYIPLRDLLEGRVEVT